MLFRSGHIDARMFHGIRYFFRVDDLAHIYLYHAAAGALQTYLEKGYSREWINQRLQAIQVRKELTDAWQDHGVKEGKEYAILTNEISRAWSGMTTREYKEFKNLKKENLRDNMSTTELILNMLAEAATKDITNADHPEKIEEHIQVAKRGGNVAKVAKETLEKETGKPVITPKKRG